MIIWLVNPFDPLPGDPEQEGRYATLAGLLVAKGHDVTWWTSSFSHRFKKPVDQQAVTTACEATGIDIRFLSVPSYQQNVGMSRLWNHYLLANCFRKAVRTEPNPPNIILTSIPPPMLARQAAIFAKEYKAKVIVDVQDLWPETFYRTAPALLRPLFPLILTPWHKAACSVYTAADAIVGVADEYVNRAVKLGGPKAIIATIPLGIDRAAFATAVDRGRCKELSKPTGEIWFAYTGSLSRSYDCLTLTYAFAKVHKTLNVPAHLFITGRGELREEIEQIIRTKNLKNVTLTGFLDFHRWAFLLNQCDVGFNASFPGAMIYLPNKIFYYFVGGLAVLNAIPGQCSRIIREGNCGLDYQAGDVDNCAQAIEQIITNREELAAMQSNSYHLAKTRYDRKVLYPEYVDLIEQVEKHNL